MHYNTFFFLQKPKQKKNIFPFTFSGRNFEYHEKTSIDDDRSTFIDSERIPKKIKNKKFIESHVYETEMSSDEYSYNKRNSIITESTISGDSEATTAKCSSVCIKNNSVSGGNGNNIDSTNNANLDNDENNGWGSGSRRRRHAINITSNPGYQV